MQVKVCLILFFASMCNIVSAQNDSIWLEKPTFNISGFLDVFYVFDFNQPQGTKRQAFLFNPNRHNDFNLNLGFLKDGDIRYIGKDNKMLTMVIQNFWTFGKNFLAIK